MHPLARLDTLRGPRASRVAAALALTLAATALLASGCATVLVSEPIERHGDGWTIILRRLADGPNSIQPMGYTVYSPERGMRFLHATFKFRNDAPQPRQFSYDACDMDLEQDRVLPGMVVRVMGIMSEMPRTETYAPGEESWRMLTFSYPEGRFPTRIKCAYVTFELVLVPGKEPPAR
jgi:hypothetical protein